MYGACKVGMHFVCLGPKSLEMDPEVVAYCQEECKKSGGSLTITDDTDAVDGADVIYTDIWVSMGEDDHSISLWDVDSTVDFDLADTQEFWEFLETYE